jgi:predicted GIY-YIG superfamily endonuclease
MWGTVYNSWVFVLDIDSVVMIIDQNTDLIESRYLPITRWKRWEFGVQGNLDDFHFEAYVYLVFDNKRNLLYVGKTTDPGRRFSQHGYTTDGKNGGLIVYILGRESEESALESEEKLIKRWRPAWNIKHNEKNMWWWEKYGEGVANVP